MGRGGKAVPLVFGDESPSLELLNEATKAPCPGKAPGFIYKKKKVISEIYPSEEGKRTFCSKRYMAYPLLSPEMSLFVLFIDVPWTANQFIDPISVPDSETSLRTTLSLSTSSV